MRLRGGCIPLPVSLIQNLDFIYLGKSINTIPLDRAVERVISFLVAAPSNRRSPRSERPDPHPILLAPY